MFLHETSATSYHDILDTWAGLELGRAFENGCTLPNIEVLEVASMAVYSTFSQPSSQPSFAHLWDSPDGWDNH